MLPRHPGWAGQPFCHPLAELARAGQRWWYLSWTLPFCLITAIEYIYIIKNKAVKCCRDGSSDSLTSSLLPALTSHLFVNFSPHLPSACLMLGVGRQRMRGLDAIKLSQKGGICSQF